MVHLIMFITVKKPGEGRKASIDFYEDYYEYGTQCTLHAYYFKF